jgi:hypothetical protein
LEEWILHQGIALSLSDTIPAEYPLSPKAHAKYGYRKLKTLQIFIKQFDVAIDSTSLENEDRD